ncbi:hypothetical protein FGB62_152g018 [Gracilaria domingensis]|nr:hypothetical protein FGB62_152g018 [Gracilaria domingensis]
MRSHLPPSRRDVSSEEVPGMGRVCGEASRECVVDDGLDAVGNEAGYVIELESVLPVGGGNIARGLEEGVLPCMGAELELGVDASYSLRVRMLVFKRGAVLRLVRYACDHGKAPDIEATKERDVSELEHGGGAAARGMGVERAERMEATGRARWKS